MSFSLCDEWVWREADLKNMTLERLSLMWLETARGRQFLPPQQIQREFHSNFYLYCSIVGGDDVLVCYTLKTWVVWDYELTHACCDVWRSLLYRDTGETYSSDHHPTQQLIHFRSHVNQCKWVPPAHIPPPISARRSAMWARRVSSGRGLGRSDFWVLSLWCCVRLNGVQTEAN